MAHEVLLAIGCAPPSAAIIAERRRQAAKIHMASKESDELELSGTTKGLGLGLLIASIVLIARGAGGRKE